MAGFQLEIEGRELSEDDFDEIWQSDERCEFPDDVIPMLLQELYEQNSEKEQLLGQLGEFAAEDWDALPIFCPDVHGGDEDPESYWRSPKQVARAMRRLSQAFRLNLPGAAKLWEMVSISNDPVYERDGGRRIKTAHSDYDHEPGDWATVCAVDLERCANALDEAAKRGETEIRLLLYIS